MGSIDLYAEPGHVSSSNEEDLWLQVKHGNEKALSFFYTTYYQGLFNYGSRFVVDHVVAEDAIQEVFIDLWSRRAALSNVRNTKQFLYKCLRNKIATKLSTFSNRIQPDNNLTRFELKLSHRSHYLNEQIERDIKERLVQLLQALPPKEKEAIFLIYFDGVTYAEAATIMSVKIKTVYNLVHLAISKLKNNKETLCPSLLTLFF